MGGEAVKYYVRLLILGLVSCPGVLMAGSKGSITLSGTVYPAAESQVLVASASGTVQSGSREQPVLIVRCSQDASCKVMLETASAMGKVETRLQGQVAEHIVYARAGTDKIVVTVVSD